MTDWDETGADGASGAGTKSDVDTFGVGIHVTETELRFVVNVPSDIDSGWTDPDAFQQLVERVTWQHLDQQTTLQTIATNVPEDETVFLGTVSLRPDETVVDHTLRVPSFDDV